MPDFNIILVNKENIEDVKSLFPEETVSAILKGEPVTALVAVSDDQVSGFLAGTLNEYTFELESVFVSPDHRRQGLGRAMLQKLCALLKEKEKDLRVFCGFTALDREMRTLPGFFRATGFSSDPPEFPCFFISEMKDMAFKKREKDGSSFEFCKLDDIPQKMLEAEEARCRGLSAPMPQSGFELDPDTGKIGFCVRDGDRIRAYLILDRPGDELLRIYCIWSELKDTGILSRLIEYAAFDLEERYAPETQIVAMVPDKRLEKLFRRFFPKAEPCSYSFIRHLSGEEDDALSGNSCRIIELEYDDPTDSIPKELLSELSRRYYSGIAYKNLEKSYDASLIWRYNDAEDRRRKMTAEMTWFDVVEDDAGKALLSEFFGRVKENEAENVIFEARHLNDKERSLLSGTGFVLTEAESRELLVTIEDLSSILDRSTKKLPSYIRSLEKIDDYQFEMGVLECAFLGRFGLLEDISSLPKQRFEQELSSCVITDDRVTGFLLVRRVCEGRYIVELLYAQQPDARKNMLLMSRHSIRAARSLLSKDDIVILSRHNNNTAQFINGLFPDRKGPVVTKGELNMSTGTK